MVTLHGYRLEQLVSAGWLEKAGHGRGTRYRWPTQTKPDLFSFSVELDNSEQSGISSEHLPVGSEHLSSEHYNKLLSLAADVRGKGKVAKQVMEATILALCAEDWLSLRTLAQLVDRKSDSLRNHYINNMLQDGRLQARVPGKPNHPNQAYRRSH